MISPLLVAGRDFCLRLDRHTYLFLMTDGQALTGFVLSEQLADLLSYLQSLK